MRTKVLALFLMWVSTFAFSQVTQIEVPERKSDSSPDWEKNHLLPNQMTSTNATTDSVNSQYTNVANWYIPGSNRELPMTNSPDVQSNATPKSHPDGLSNQQIIAVSPGWSGLSAFVVPDDLSVEEIFASYSDQLIILYNQQGTYFPSQQINTLENWNPASGYVAKFAEPADIEFYGQINQNRKIDLALGWNLIPVLSTCPVDVASFFLNKNVRLVKEVSGYKLYWPEMGINSLGELVPGKAYYVLMGGSESVLYPNCGLQTWQCGDPIIDSRDNQSYNTVQIGEQCWMAENLNIGTMINVVVPMTDNGSIEKYCQNNSVDSCIEYGGLYQWNEMMRYSTSGRGICPTGWHVSTNEEFIELTEYLGGEDIAGNKMKETGFRHWYSPNDGSTNSSGFTAFAGGFTDPAGTIYAPGSYCDFWVSTGDNPENGMRWWLANGYPGIGHNTDYPKGFGFSVRCVKDTLQPTWSCGDPIIDSRDNHSYGTVQIGDQCWMAENMNVGTMIAPLSESDNGIIEKLCYDDNPANCDEYGGLYFWDEIMNYTNGELNQGICPDGWHVPSRGQWDDLILNLGGTTIAGGKLKETGYQHWDEPNTGATNASGFTAYGGGAYSWGYGALKQMGLFWTSSQMDAPVYKYLFYESEGVFFDTGIPEWHIYVSLRCIKTQCPIITTANAGPDQLNVEGNSTILEGNNIPILEESGEWTIVSGNDGSLSDSSDPHSAFTGNPEESYVLTWAISNFCGESDIDSVMISFAPAATSYCGDITELIYDGQVYHTVQIGDQCWLKENLNTGQMINGSTNQTDNSILEKYCYNNEPDSCAEYGGLYQWNELMQYTTQPGAQGICPEGWHIPTSLDACILASFVDEATDCNDPFDILSYTAGGKLKEEGFRHWMDPNDGATNETGFTALGSGANWENNHAFTGIREFGFYASSTRNTEDNNLGFYMVRVQAHFRKNHSELSRGVSVRCIKDSEPQTWGCGDPLLDTRDNQSYNTVQIGDQCWMAENLNTGSMIQANTQAQDNQIIEKYCFDNNESNCSEYGGFYSWAEMMAYNTTPGAPGICPDGFHIPTDEQWAALSEFLGGSTSAGGKMKETGFLHWFEPNEGATNESGFSALGTAFSNQYSVLKSSTYMWSSTIAQPQKAWYRYLTFDASILFRSSVHGMTSGLSVRCIKN